MTNEKEKPKLPKKMAVNHRKRHYHQSSGVLPDRFPKDLAQKERKIWGISRHGDFSMITVTYDFNHLQS